MMQYWYKIHKWTSLVCAVFLLIMCASALPLIFKQEINDFNRVQRPAVSRPAPSQAAPAPTETPPVSLARQATNLLDRHPGYSLRTVSLDYEQQSARFSLQVEGKRLQISTDLQTGRVIEQSERSAGHGGRGGQSDNQIKYAVIPEFLNFMHIMHVNLYLGAFGRSLLGWMCGLSIVSLLTGLYLYAPFMRTMPFGAIRTAPRRNWWMDWHKLSGIVTLVWAVLLCLSGFILVFGGPVSNAWNENVRQALLAQYQGTPVSTSRISLDDVLETAQRALPERKITSIELPQEGGKMPWHYVVRTQGEGFAAHFQEFVWVDASTGTVTATIAQPWYLQAISLARPAHFSNHDTLALKILWFVTDALTCFMIITGIYAWFVKFRPVRPAAQKQTQAVRPVRQSNRQIWLQPVIIIVLSVVGILAPLAGGQYNTPATLALATPLILTVYYWLRR
ncbi:Uncharacterized iron-regulated membrane protein [Dendrosporobacter quercicolus]|uniref:Uncharacterized iron-regulated membrane protein n=1 Tax=Dendrosporobacter quercicolus TaxID=146817 RepID=A0A1G9YCG6_9FIRM|nr:PepSY-associated TM helix domain-containing protein [Dendrosporobacter quercicolus]SDN06677.1 Uncharacterized iron-regulated membrane protein [Dendrosporobacter quercicolus]